MKALFALGLITVLALVLSGRRFWSLGRYPVFSFVNSGGWGVVLLGIIVGPSFFPVLDKELISLINPIVIFCLGWVGVTVGLQIRPGIMQTISRRVISYSLRDIAATILLSFIAYLILIGLFFSELNLNFQFFIAIVLAISNAGWQAESRSLNRVGFNLSIVSRRFLTASSGLIGVMTLLLLGIAQAVFIVAEVNESTFVLFKELVFSLLSISLLALAIAAIARALLKLAYKQSVEFILVLIGIISLISGVANMMGVSPLFLGLLSGIVLANIAREESLKLQRILLEAEYLFATALMLIAGVIANFNLEYKFILLIVAGLLIRMIAKKIVVRDYDQRFHVDNTQAYAVYASTLRQAALSVVILVSLCQLFDSILVHHYDYMHKILAVVIAQGFFALLITLILMRGKLRQNE